MAGHEERPDGGVAEDVEHAVEGASRVLREGELAEGGVPFERAIEDPLDEGVRGAALAVLAGAEVDGSPLGHVREAGDVIDVQVREEDARERLLLRGEPRGRVGVDLHGVQVHEGGDEAADGGVVAVVHEGPLHAGVDEEEAARRVAEGVEVDLNGLLSLGEAGGLGLGVVEVDQAAAVDRPVGGVDCLDGDGAGLLDDGLQIGRGAGLSEVGGGEGVGGGVAADGERGGDGEDDDGDGGEDLAGAAELHAGETTVYVVA